jgi:hypothetical protein
MGRKVDITSATDVFNLKFPFDDFINLQTLKSNIPEATWGFSANKPLDENESGLLFEYSADINNTSPQASTKLAVAVNVKSLLA